MSESAFWHEPAFLLLTGWHGVSRQPVFVIGETPKRYRIVATERTRLAGRRRWLEPGNVVLVPKAAIRFEAKP